MPKNWEFRHSNVTIPCWSSGQSHLEINYNVTSAGEQHQMTNLKVRSEPEVGWRGEQFAFAWHRTSLHAHTASGPELQNSSSAWRAGCLWVHGAGYLSCQKPLCLILLLHCNSLSVLWMTPNKLCAQELASLHNKCSFSAYWVSQIHAFERKLRQHVWCALLPFLYPSKSPLIPGCIYPPTNVLQTKVCQQTKAIETPEHVYWLPIMVRQITSPGSDRICWPESHWHAFNWTDICWHTDKRTGWLLLLLCQSNIQHSIQPPLHPPCHS